MKKAIKKAVLIGALALMGTGCSFVQVDPAQVGKILSPAGYEPEILPTGKYTLGWRQQLVTIDTSTNMYSPTITAKLKDQMELSFQVKFRGRLRSDAKTLNSMFNDITVRDGNVTFTQIFAIYGAPVLENRARAIVSEYTTEEIQVNYKRISNQIAVEVLGALKTAPIELSDLSLGSIQYPTSVVESINAAKQRVMDLEKDKADNKIKIQQKTNELALVEADYKVQMRQADIIADYNKRISQGISPQLLELKRIEVAKILAENAKDSDKVFVPMEAMSSVGMNIRALSGK